MSGNGDLSWAAAPIRALPPYRGPVTLADFPDPSRRPRLVHLNESPTAPSPRVAAAIAEATRDLNRYPDISGRALATALGAATRGDGAVGDSLRWTRRGRRDGSGKSARVTGPR